MTAVTPIDRLKSVCNGGVIDVFGGVFCVVVEFYVCIRPFVIGLSPISFFFSLFDMFP